MPEENKAIVRRLMDEVWTKGNLSLVDQLISVNYTHHDTSTPDFGPGPEGEKKRATLYRSAFPDLQFTVEDVIAEGDTVSVRWSCQGTHRGPLSGIAPSGKKVSISGMSVARFAGGKMVEGWVNWDALGLLQQLDVVPELFKAKGAAS
jgi:ketosteroid isomerase-like protein